MDCAIGVGGKVRVVRIIPQTYASDSVACEQAEVQYISHFLGRAGTVIGVDGYAHGITVKFIGACFPSCLEGCSADHSSRFDRRELELVT